MACKIEFATSALREFKALDRPIQHRLAAQVNELSVAPFPPGSRKLQGTLDHYRILVGDYRLIYRVDGRRLTVLILKVGHRKDVYRRGV